MDARMPDRGSGNSRSLSRPRLYQDDDLLPGTLAGLQSAGVGDFYWIPSVVNFPGVDSVLGDRNGNLSTFQASIAKDHKSPEAGIKRVWVELPSAVRTSRTWYCVVVTQTEEGAESYRVKFSNWLESFRLDSTTSVRIWGGVLHS